MCMTSHLRTNVYVRTPATQGGDMGRTLRCTLAMAFSPAFDMATCIAGPTGGSVIRSEQKGIELGKATIARTGTTNYENFISQSKFDPRSLRRDH